MSSRIVEQFPSSSTAGKFYTVKENNGILSCDCPPWIFNRSGNRTCKHTESVRPRLHVAEPAAGAAPAPKSKPAASPIALNVVYPTDTDPAGPGVDFVKPMLAVKGEPLIILRIAEDPEWIAERKLDGGRYALYIGSNGARLFSKHVSVKTSQFVEKTANVPHLVKPGPAALDGTVLDGEITVPGGDFGKVLEIMGAQSDEAILRQTSGTKARLTVFDCPRYKGQDISGKTLVERQAIVKEILNALANPDIVFIEQRLEKKMEWFNQIVANGGEGIILKRLNSRYEYGKRSANWVKVKRVQTYDVVIMGFEKTESENWTIQGLIGSVRFGVYKNGRLQNVGTTSGMTLETRRDMSANPSRYIGQVAEIAGQEVLRDGIRHPRYIRLRPDVNPHDCTWEKLVKS